MKTGRRRVGALVIAWKCEFGFLKKEEKSVSFNQGSECLSIKHTKQASVFFQELSEGLQIIP